MCSLLWGVPLCTLSFALCDGAAGSRVRCRANRAVYHLLVRAVQSSSWLCAYLLTLFWTSSLFWPLRFWPLSLFSCVRGWPFAAHQFVPSYAATILIIPCCLGKMIALFPRSYVFRSGRIFDSTLGYLGEGPDRSWTILSSNIGSFIKDNTWKGWTDDVICLQETRIGWNNFRNATKSAAAFGKNLILGDLLPGLFRSDGSGSTSHGGVALKGSFTPNVFKPLGVKFSPRLRSWFSTSMVNRGLRLHMTSSSSTMSSFVIFCRLQVNSGISLSLLLVISNLHHSNTLRSLLRCTLLIGLILSPATLKMAPLIDPSRATFDWLPIFQVGPIHVKFAALDTSQVGKPSCPRDYECHQTMWDAALTSQFDRQLPEELWFDINQHAISALVTLGATWSNGVRKRAAPPVFQSKQYCPGQMPSGAAVSLLHLSWLHNARAKVFDIQAKVAKPYLSDKECDILHNARIKLNRLLSRLKAPFQFHSQSRLSLVSLHECHLWLQCQIERCEHDLKFKRINAWKDKIRESAKSTRAYIFHHLKNKAQDQPNNLFTSQLMH